MAAAQFYLYAVLLIFMLQILCAWTQDNINQQATRKCEIVHSADGRIFVVCTFNHDIFASKQGFNLQYTRISRESKNPGIAYACFWEPTKTEVKCAGDEGYHLYSTVYTNTIQIEVPKKDLHDKEYTCQLADGTFAQKPCDATTTRCLANDPVPTSDSSTNYVLALAIVSTAFGTCCLMIGGFFVYKKCIRCRSFSRTPSMTYRRPVTHKKQEVYPFMQHDGKRLRGSNETIASTNNNNNITVMVATEGAVGPTPNLGSPKISTKMSRGENVVWFQKSKDADDNDKERGDTCVCLLGSTPTGLS